MIEHFWSACGVFPCDVVDEGVTIDPHEKDGRPSIPRCFILHSSPRVCTIHTVLCHHLAIVLPSSWYGLELCIHPQSLSPPPVKLIIELHPATAKMMAMVSRPLNPDEEIAFFGAGGLGAAAAFHAGVSGVLRYTGAGGQPVEK